MLLGLDLPTWEQLMLLSLGLAALSAVLVVVGTFSVVRLTREENHALRERIAEFGAQLGEANVEIARANERAAELENRAASLTVESESLKGEVANANERAAVLEVEAAKAKLEQEQLKSKMAWRRLTKEQYKILVSELKGRSIDVMLSFVGTDPEASVFRDDLNRALEAADLKVSYFSGYSVAIGLIIHELPANADRDLLVMAFRKAGLPLEIRAKGGNRISSPDRLEIVVGSKPPPF